MKEEWEYRLIDGNWSRNAIAYCWRYRGYLTLKQMRVHKCKERRCKRLDCEMFKKKEGVNDADDR